MSATKNRNEATGPKSVDMAAIIPRAREGSAEASCRGVSAGSMGDEGRMIRVIRRIQLLLWGMGRKDFKCGRCQLSWRPIRQKGACVAAGDRGEEPLPEVSRSALALRTRAPRKLGPRGLLSLELPTLPRGRAVPARLPSRGSWNPRPRRPARFRPGRACAPASAGCAPRLCLGR